MAEMKSNIAAVAVKEERKGPAATPALRAARAIFRPPSAFDERVGQAVAPRAPAASIAPATPSAAAHQAAGAEEEKKEEEVGTHYFTSTAGGALEEQVVAYRPGEAPSLVALKGSNRGWISVQTAEDALF